MPTFKQSLDKNGKYSDNQLQEVVKNVIENGMTLRQAAHEFEILQTTVRTYVNFAKQAESFIVSRKSMLTTQVVLNHRSFYIYNKL